MWLWLKASRSLERRQGASIIGGITEEPVRVVLMHTRFGGTRMIAMLVGRQPLWSLSSDGPARELQIIALYLAKPRGAPIPSGIPVRGFAGERGR